MNDSVKERVKEIIAGIVKSQECVICLDLLNDPVSTGCSHYFCRSCIKTVLSSNYKAPCPLCKKTFTKRSLQEKRQLQRITQAVKKLTAAYKKDTGMEVSPPKGPRVSVTSPASRDWKQHLFEMCHPSPLKPLNRKSNTCEKPPHARSKRKKPDEKKEKFSRLKIVNEDSNPKETNAGRLKADAKTKSGCPMSPYGASTSLGCAYLSAPSTSHDMNYVINNTSAIASLTPLKEVVVANLGSGGNSGSVQAKSDTQNVQGIQQNQAQSDSEDESVAKIEKFLKGSKSEANEGPVLSPTEHLVALCHSTDLPITSTPDVSFSNYRPVTEIPLLSDGFVDGTDSTVFTVSGEGRCTERRSVSTKENSSHPAANKKRKSFGCSKENENTSEEDLYLLKGHKKPKYSSNKTVDSDFEKDPYVFVPSQRSPLKIKIRKRLRERIRKAQMSKSSAFKGSGFDKKLKVAGERKRNDVHCNSQAVAETVANLTEYCEVSQHADCVNSEDLDVLLFVTPQYSVESLHVHNSSSPEGEKIKKSKARKTKTPPGEKKEKPINDGDNEEIIFLKAEIAEAEKFELNMSEKESKAHVLKLGDHSAHCTGTELSCKVDLNCKTDALNGEKQKSSYFCSNIFIKDIVDNSSTVPSAQSASTIRSSESIEFTTEWQRQSIATSHTSDVIEKQTGNNYRKGDNVSKSSKNFHEIQHSTNQTSKEKCQNDSVEEILKKQQRNSNHNEQSGSSSLFSEIAETQAFFANFVAKRDCSEKDGNFKLSNKRDIEVREMSADVKSPSCETEQIHAHAATTVPDNFNCMRRDKMLTEEDQLVTDIKSTFLEIEKPPGDVNEATCSKNYFNSQHRKQQAVLLADTSSIFSGTEKSNSYTAATAELAAMNDANRNESVAERERAEVADEGDCISRLDDTEVDLIYAAPKIFENEKNAVPNDELSPEELDLKDLEKYFKKPTRKTFALDVESQELEALSGDQCHNTLDMLNELYLEHETCAVRSPNSRSGEHSFNKTGNATAMETTINYNTSICNEKTVSVIELSASKTLSLGISPSHFPSQDSSIVNGISSVTSNQNIGGTPFSGKTKVVKRLCLTLEEIHSYFKKSDESAKSEVICVLPSPSNDFKIELSIADQTLNVSMLKVSNNGENTPSKVETPRLVRHGSASLLPSSFVQRMDDAVKACEPNLVNTEQTPDAVAHKSTENMPEISVSPSGLSILEKSSYQEHSEMGSDNLRSDKLLPSTLNKSKESHQLTCQQDSLDMHNNVIPCPCDKNDPYDCSVSDISHRKCMPVTAEQVKESMPLQDIHNTRDPMLPQFEKEIFSDLGNGMWSKSCTPILDVSEFESKLRGNDDKDNSFFEHSDVMECNNLSEDSSSSDAFDPYIYRPKSLHATQRSIEEPLKDSESFSNDPDMIFANSLVAPLRKIGERLSQSKPANDKSSMQTFPGTQRPSLSGLDNARTNLIQQNLQKEQSGNHFDPEKSIAGRPSKLRKSSAGSRMGQVFTKTSCRKAPLQADKADVTATQNNKKFKRIKMVESSDESSDEFSISLCRRMNLNKKSVTIPSGNAELISVNKDGNKNMEKHAVYSPEVCAAVPCAEGNVQCVEPDSQTDPSTFKNTEDLVLPNDVSSSSYVWSCEDMPPSQARGKMALEIEEMKERIKMMEEQINKSVSSIVKNNAEDEEHHDEHTPVNERKPSVCVKSAKDKNVIFFSKELDEDSFQDSNESDELFSPPLSPTPQQTKVYRVCLNPMSSDCSWISK